jgi:short-subunit dehydrogenase
MGKVIVITGLGDGMGRHAAKMLAELGYTIAGFDVDKMAIESLQKELGDKHYLTTLDITDRPGILAFRDEVLKRYGAVDTVLSNVGIGFFGPFEEVNLERALKCLEINVIGAAAIFQSFIPAMRKQGHGKLIAMSSLVGRIPFPFESIYTASKFALEGMLLSMKIEVAPFGIQLGIIEPAQVSTTFAAKIHFLPPEGSVYRDRVKRFIDRDNELIKTAPTPEFAAKRIVQVVTSDKPKIFNQIDSSSAFLQALNRFLPVKVRDFILINYMNIKP